MPNIKRGMMGAAGASGEGATLYAWGVGTSGALGQEDNILDKSSPVQVGEENNWASVAGHFDGFHAIQDDGTLWAWGDNSSGALGIGHAAATNSSPVQIAGGGTDWESVDGGYRTIVAIKTGGTLWTWGDQDQGTTGTSAQGGNRSCPVQVGSLTDWAQCSAGINAAAAAIRDNGTLWTWGNGADGRTGHGDLVDRSSPTQVSGTTWAQVSAGHAHMAAIKTDGTAWYWGDGTLNTHPWYAGVIQIGSDTNWSSVSSGYKFSMFIKTNGTLWGWGQNTQGQLGNGGVEKVDANDIPVQVGSLTTWSKVSAGYDHTIALKTDGTLWGWGGALTDGATGHGDQILRSSPVQIGDLTTWGNIVDGMMNQSAAIGKA